MSRTSARLASSRTALAAVLPAILILAVGAGSSSAGPGTPAKRCSDVPFTPNSDDVAANVRASRMTCKAARAFIRAAHGHPARRFRGFTCTRTRVEEATLPHTRYRCVRGAQRIRWDRF
jgi:hypothetical protein